MVGALKPSAGTSRSVRRASTVGAASFVMGEIEMPADVIDLTPRVWKTKFAHDPMRSDIALADQ